MKKILILMVLFAANIADGQKIACKGLTVKGQPCKSVIVGKDGYCRIHSPSAKHCKHLCKDGHTCKGIAGKNGYCGLHTKEGGNK